jgi:hypothetical protein
LKNLPKASRRQIFENSANLVTLPSPQLRAKKVENNN